MGTARCIDCGMPALDHGSLRYVWRAWWRHAFLRLISRPLSHIQDTGV